MVFIPTVSHLRAYLSVFNPVDTKIPPPPPPQDSVPGNIKRPLLLVYGFLGLHRDTSEWSAQGISATAAGLIEAAKRTGFWAVVVDSPMIAAGEDEEERLAEGTGSVVAGLAMLEEEVPLLSGSVARAVGDFDEAAWTGRKVTVDRILGRWFRHKEGEWSKISREATNEITL